MTAAEPTPPTEAKRKSIATTSIDAAAGTATVTFSNGKTVVMSIHELAHSKVPHLVTELALMGICREIASAYNVKRANVDEAHAAAQARYTSVIEKGRYAREPGQGSLSAQDIAINVVAALKGKTPEHVRAIVEGYTDTKQPDGSVFTADQKRKAFVQKVKTDPQTAAAYAAARHPVKKSKPVADFSEF